MNPESSESPENSESHESHASHENDNSLEGRGNNTAKDLPTSPLLVASSESNIAKS